ncbi:MAG TPA: excinuclease ABC subunit UvrA [Bacteroidales bacterium]|nr:excinuclease ABC subunit UvrA [Bacteroidales bacterium]HSA44144.1 excinuclease ABC subunit UvrA [Bacteroidales bacterium]
MDQAREFPAETIEVLGARAHNLKNCDLLIPRNKLVVITGLSGSGKSSLAFDTLYAEGQRRYIETFSAYARQFLGNLERPDVDKINGLSPVISIEQKSVSRNPRSTVGTITEIYDFIRLLFARIADAYSYASGEKMIRYSENDIIRLIEERYDHQHISLLAPLVKGRKGHYRELFEQVRKQGFSRVRVDGMLRELAAGLQVDRYKTHDIEILIDRIHVKGSNRRRLEESIQTAMKHGKGSLMVLDGDSDSATPGYYSRHLMCPLTGISYEEPEPNTFSFNSPYGSCPKCNGLGTIAEVDLNKIIPDPGRSIRKGGLAPLGEYRNSWIFKQLEAIGEKHGFSLDTPIADLGEQAINTILNGSDEFIRVRHETMGVTSTYNLAFEGIVSFIVNQNTDSAPKGIQKWAGGFMNRMTCPECQGSRLKKESLYFRIEGKNIAELTSLEPRELLRWTEETEPLLEARKQAIGHEIFREIRTRLQFLLEVGLDYLALNRPAVSLSGGESQRIRLATQIGSQLQGVLYILDEPSIGLHQRDNLRLIKALSDLRDIGNSIIVVEHDKEMILSADHVIDIGPGAGKHGGRIVAQGRPETIAGKDSITGQYLSGSKKIPVPAQRRPGNGKFLTLTGARGNNLKHIDLSIPLGKLICITGVSGSGKSSLINETLYPVLSAHFYRSEHAPLPYDTMDGIRNIDKVIEIDQSPIGRTPRSNPATYTGVFDEIRKLFVQVPEARMRAYQPGRFSFNVKGGRCETCSGAGIRIIEMNFLPDVHVQCETCNGKRYNRETLEIRYKGKNISDVLEMTIGQAVTFFENIPSILLKIKTLDEVGLGYITLGQQSTTLSGGEAQRVKLATELSRRDTGNTLYILDEPTTGLHFEDVSVLMKVLNKLVDKGNTVIVIEHNLDVIKVADHLIDLGPEGGAQGGTIVCTGTPEEIAAGNKGHTAAFIRKELHIS